MINDISINFDENSQGLAIRTPFDMNFITQLKANIPSSARRWDKHKKVWLVPEEYGQFVHELILDCFSENINIPTPEAKANISNEQQILDIRYIGVCRDRGGTEPEAYGWRKIGTEGDWDTVFPESVLRAFFEFNDNSAKNSRGSLFAILGVGRIASSDEIKKSFRRLSLQWHPDVCKEPDAQERFLEIKSAYETLSNPISRAKYEAGLTFQNSLGNGGYGFGRTDQNYRAPLRCGLIVAECYRQIGRMRVTKILKWEDIIDTHGRTLVTSWPQFSENFVESWI